MRWSCTRRARPAASPDPPAPGVELPGPLCDEARARAGCGAKAAGCGLARVTGYAVDHASHDGAYDGGVTAFTDTPTGARLQLLWTPGVCTDSTHLANVRPGLYVALVLSVDGEPVHCLHTCGPARVDVHCGSDEASTRV